MKKIKFRNAAEKRKHEENQKTWEQLKAKYEPVKKFGRQDNRLVYRLDTPPGRESQSIPSRRSAGVGSTALAPSMTYTGTEMIGIGQLHKSNAVPVFREQDAVDLSTMRR